MMRGAQPIAMPVRKTLALLVYLALEGRSPRDRLADLFWPELDEPTARRNLRRALHRLRTVGLREALVVDSDLVAVAGLVSELDGVEQALADGQGSAVRTQLSAPFLDGLDLDDPPRFGDWLRERRERRRRRWRQGGGRDSEAPEACGDFRAALDTQQFLCDDGPLQDSGWRCARAVQERHPLAPVARVRPAHPRQACRRARAAGRRCGPASLRADIVATRPHRSPLP